MVANLLDMKRSQGSSAHKFILHTSVHSENVGIRPTKKQV